MPNTNPILHNIKYNRLKEQRHSGLKKTSVSEENITLLSLPQIQPLCAFYIRAASIQIPKYWLEKKLVEYLHD